MQALQAPLVSVINRALADCPQGRARLIPYFGKTARLEAAPFFLVFRVCPDGTLETSSVGPDVTLRAPLACVPSLARGDAAALRRVTITGNAGFAQEIAYIAQHLPVDWAAPLEGRLARLLPPTWAAAATQTVTRSARGVARWAHDGAGRLGRNLSEYALEEAEWIVRPRDVQDFAGGVDALTDALARLDKRLTRLEGRTR
jgi:ubiquinone biosynthesis protein UbiJ